MAKKRKNGQGTVRLRNDGRWEGRHIVGYDENGKAKQKSVLAKTKAECVEKLKKLQEEYTEVAPLKGKTGYAVWGLDELLVRKSLQAIHPPHYAEGL